MESVIFHNTFLLWGKLLIAVIDCRQLDGIGIVNIQSQQHRLCKTFRSNILIGIKFFVPHAVCTINKKKYTGSVDFTGFSVFCTNYCRADTNRRSMRSYICTVRSQEKKCLNSLTWNGVVGWSFKVHPLLIEKWKYVICEISTVVWIDSCGVVQSASGCMWYISFHQQMFSLSLSVCRHSFNEEADLLTLPQKGTLFNKYGVTMETISPLVYHQWPFR